MLMIVLLYGNFKFLLKASNDTIPLRARSSDVFVSVPISLIKEANVKLIERKYLIAINKEQDSIISLKDKYIIEQDSIINKQIMQYNSISNLNKELNNKIEQQSKRNNIIYGVGIGVIGALIISLICN